MFKELMQEIIDKKYKDLKLDQKNKNNIFWKIKEFEGNAIGQIGEEFIKKIFKKMNIKFDDTKENVHDEYDILLDKKIKIEIKTARKGAKSNTFQFNGINPRYNYEFIIFLGILENDLVYRILNKNQITYIHKERRFLVNLETTRKWLVKMNPNNEVNFKLTLNIKELINIGKLINELEDILNNNYSK